MGALIVDPCHLEQIVLLMTAECNSYLFSNHFVTFILSSLLFLFCYRNIITEVYKKVIVRKDICKVLIRHNFQLIDGRTIKEDSEWTYGEEDWCRSAFELRNLLTETTGPKTPELRNSPSGEFHSLTNRQPSQWIVIFSDKREKAYRNVRDCNHAVYE